MKETQLNFIRNHLLTHGEISRNFCLSNYISRLGARINDLKKEGFEFKVKYIKTKTGQDYIYKLISQPKNVLGGVTELSKANRQDTLPMRLPRILN